MIVLLAAAYGIMAIVASAEAMRPAKVRTLSSEGSARYLAGLHTSGVH